MKSYVDLKMTKKIEKKSFFFKKKISFSKKKIFSKKNHLFRWNSLEILENAHKKKSSIQLEKNPIPYRHDLQQLC